MNEWVPVAVALVGSGLSGYVGVRLALARLEVEVPTMQEEIKSLRQDRHKHANVLQDHETRLHFLEKRDE